jgi:formyltetrahydrofolate hydrolase
MRMVFHDNGKGRPSLEALNEKFGASVGRQLLTVIGSEPESVVLNRASEWHAERRVFRNGCNTVVLR